MVLDHPIWTKSKIPPRTIKAINDIPTGNRNEFIAELISNYQRKASRIHSHKAEAIERWITGQYKHLMSVSEELQAILDLETSGETEWEGITYNDNPNGVSTKG
tara:strand:+ start:499 stop:810 length:312 start_codon:yes stop_codon:yes gene_type:complete